MTYLQTYVLSKGASQRNAFVHIIPLPTATKRQNERTRSAKLPKAYLLHKLVVPSESLARVWALGLRLSFRPLLLLMQNRNLKPDTSPLLILHYHQNPSSLLNTLCPLPQPADSLKSREKKRVKNKASWRPLIAKKFKGAQSA